jgi:TatD DNase family protein
MIIDTHIHICDERYDSDREEMLLSAALNGVKKFINIGAEINENKRVINYQKEGVYKAIGLHPHYIQQLNDNEFLEIKGYLKNTKDIVAIGEIGLDFYKNETPVEKQKEVFKKFLQLSKEFDLPVIIHSREAHNEVFNLLKEFNINKKGVIHCFTGDTETAKKFIDIGYYLGIGGVVTFPNAKILKETVKNISLDFLVLETDAPYLAPQQQRGKRNESAYLKYIIDEISILKNVDVKEIEEKTSHNAEKLFNLN